MNSILTLLRSRGNCLLKDNFVLFSTGPRLRQISRPVLRKQVPAPTRRKIEPYGWFMLIIPAASFGLGVWQIQRKSWKEGLIADLKDRTNRKPIELPENWEDLRDLEFQKIHVKGTFLHDKEIYMGPRSLLDKDENMSLPKPIFGDRASNQGYLVVTPLKLADREETILVNRGWVTTHLLKPQTRIEGQVEGQVDVIGILRLNENRPNFAMRNREGSNIYFYRDLQAMCAATGASPIFLDQTLDYNPVGGPIGGQTRVALRNEHFSYIITWFSLSAATSYMWFKKFIVK